MLLFRYNLVYNLVYNHNSSNYVQFIPLTPLHVPMLCAGPPLSLEKGSGFPLFTLSDMSPTCCTTRLLQIQYATTMPTSPTEETDPTHNKANLTDVKVTAFGCTETQIGVTRNLSCNQPKLCNTNWGRTKLCLQSTHALRLELGTNETMFAISGGAQKRPRTRIPQGNKSGIGLSTPD